MSVITITQAQARRFLLTYQGLWPPYGLVDKSGILAYIRRVGCIQFDPLNIVGQNPELVLQARVSGFQPAMLRELLYEDRKLLDGWDKNMSIYPVEDWPYFERRRQTARTNPGKSPEPVRAVLPQIRQALAERGPLSSLDLNLNQTVEWAWAPTRLARAALESMYFWGELIVHHKVHTRKVYDFAVRHLPEELLRASDPNETEEQYHDWSVLRRIGSIGLLWNRAGDAWLGMADLKSKDRQAALQRLLRQGQVCQVAVEGIGLPFYLRSEDWSYLDQTLNADAPSPQAVVIAPLDNLLWDRRLVKTLFDFDYRWEVYKPVAERGYGYYVLPILYGDRFIARFEPGRDKQSRALIIKQWWWEPGVRPSTMMQTEVRDCFERFTRYLGANQLQIDRETMAQQSLAWLN